MSASGSSSQGAFLSGSMAVSVADRNVTDLTIPLQGSLAVTGRIEFAGTSDGPTAAQYRSSLWLVMEAADGVRGTRAPIPLTVDEAWTFRATVPPGSYVVHVWSRAAPAPDLRWTLKSVLAGGRDVADAALVVATDDVAGIVATFTDRPSTLFGTARDANGAPDTAAAVLLFPADRALWMDYGPSPRRVRYLRVDRAGRFSISAAPVGDYFIMALPETAAADWQDPSFLSRASQLATRVRVDEGQAVAIDLRTQRW